MEKLIIFTAPSGAGKTTIVRSLLESDERLSFSVSATTRSKRPNETDGKDYYFLSTEEFKQKIDLEEFIEWEKVYADTIYGTLKTEVERIWGNNQAVVFDIDVKGAANIKEQYGDKALSIFVKPPSKEVLFERLANRQTESIESLKKRTERAEYELSFENKFDKVLVNDQLEEAILTAKEMVDSFLNQKLF